VTFTKPTDDNRREAIAGRLPRSAAGRAFEHLAAFRWTVNLVGRDEPENVQGFRGADFFATLGVQPVSGRAFLPEEETPDGIGASCSATACGSADSRPTRRSSGSRST
jgi:hypothetical protein